MVAGGVGVAAVAITRGRQPAFRELGPADEMLTPSGNT